MNPSSASITDEAAAIAHALHVSHASNGDDATPFPVGGGACCISTDSTIAGVHAPHGTSPVQLGRRAAARALSDLGAMGALPIGVTCAVLVPADGWTDATAALDGVAARCGEQGAALLGGDFARTPAEALTLVVTVVGRRAGAVRSRTGFVGRTGARIDDELHVTGRLGAAAHAIATGASTLPEPPDRLRAGTVLARFARAMLDLSDGLARDASLLASAPDLIPSIELDLLPCADGVTDPLLAASGGDDYELLVALPPERVDDARAALARACPELPLTRIGRIADAAHAHPFTRAGSPVQVGGGFLHS